MTLDDIPEMLESWRAGDLRFQDVYFLCLDLLRAHEAEAILSMLPPELREEIGARLRTDWDNQAPIEDCSIFHSGSGEHPATKIIVERARRWIAQHPEDRSS